MRSEKTTVPSQIAWQAVNTNKTPSAKQVYDWWDAAETEATRQLLALDVAEPLNQERRKSGRDKKVKVGGTWIGFDNLVALTATAAASPELRLHGDSSARSLKHSS